jgi:glycosyltransferase involved in cell wall biosynthesis
MSVARVTSVAHVLWSGNVGGIERLVCDLADEQVQQGLHVTVAFGRAEGPFVLEARERGVNVFDLALSSGYDVRPSRMTRGEELLGESDVLHLHGFNISFAVLAGRMSRPVVFTEHGNFALGRTIGPRGRVKRHLQRRFLSRSVNSVVANSHHTARRLHETYGIDLDRVSVVYNGIRLDQWVPPAARNTDDRLRAVFVGRLVPFKRVDRAIEGLALATRRETMSFDIVGGGPLGKQLHAYTESLEIGDRVRFLGYQRDPQEVVAGADVLILPSEREPFGLAVLEGCAKGALPIIFADAGGALEVLPPDGLVVESAQHLARSLDRLVGSSALSDEARRRRAEWVRKRFPISATATGYASIYKAALANSREEVSQVTRDRSEQLWTR